MNDAAQEIFNNAEPRQHTGYVMPDRWDRETALKDKERAIDAALVRATDDVLVLQGAELTRAKKRLIAIEKSKAAIIAERAELESDKAAAQQARIDSVNAEIIAKGKALDEACQALDYHGKEMLACMRDVISKAGALYMHADTNTADLVQELSPHGSNLALGVWLKQLLGATIVMPEFTIEGAGQISLAAFIGKSQYLPR